MATRKSRVLILYNLTGDDEYEKIREVDPTTLGFTPQYSIRVKTALEEYQAIAKALKREGFATRMANVEESFQTLYRFLSSYRPDVIFNFVEHFRGDARLETAVASMYELANIPYTGASPFALGLCQRKGLTKRVLLSNGVPTPRYRLQYTPRIPKRHGLHYPLIVKPAREDASSGVEKESVVYDFPQLKERLEKVFGEFRPPMLVEEYVEGRELHVSILGNDPPVVLPMIEFDFSQLPPDHPRIISYNAKWNPLDEVFHQLHSICPAKLPKRLQARVEKACLEAYRVTGCRDYARLDVRLSPRGHVFILEVNPNPDLTEGVSFMESAEKAGLTFSATLRRIVEYALARRPVPTTPKR